jgi:hypothetical protein
MLSLILFELAVGIFQPILDLGGHLSIVAVKPPRVQFQLLFDVIGGLVRAQGAL